MNRKGLVGVALWISSVSIACGGGSTPADTGTGIDSGTRVDTGTTVDTTTPVDTGVLPDGASLTATQACTDFATARCNKINSCSNGIGVVRDYPDMGTCISRNLGNCMSILAVPNTTATPGLEEACSAAITTESCSDFRDAITQTACVAPPGPLANGMPCITSGQCMSTVCLVPNNSQCGTCTVSPAEGDDCSLTGCGRTLVCHQNPTTGSHLCRAPTPSGGTCDDDHPCAASLDCVMATAGATSGTCMSFGSTVGAACTTASVVNPQCDGFYGLYCDTSVHMCAMDTTATPTHACGPMSGTTPNAYCIHGGTCSPAMTGVTRTCVAAAADGTACDSSMSLDCVAPSRCVRSASDPDGGTAGTCLALNASLSCP